MTPLPILLPIALLQVGPNPQGADTFSAPDITRNRPPRPEDGTDPLGLSDPNAQWLAQCLTQIEADPARAHTQAQIKLIEAIGAEKVVANHCLGLASTELGLWEDARRAFLAARTQTPQEEIRARARFGAMAGNAALAGGDLEGALVLLTQAMSEAETAASTPLQVITAIDIARILVTLDRPEDALAPLERATTLAPQDSESWLLKATLLRRLDRLGDAQAAIEEAVALAPQDVEIGLEAGVIAIFSGREAAARASWQSVIDTQPDSLAAQKARGYLEQIGPASRNSPAASPESAQP
ncbi:MAG: tetratricopeptide repeat protein [Pseudomonadota bacterium]